MMRMNMRGWVVSGVCLVMGIMSLASCSKDAVVNVTPPVIFVDTIVVDTNFTVADPCLTSSCALNTMTIDGGTEALEMEFYNNYDILDTSARWGRLKSAIIVVHGNNRNANEYFNWMTNSVLNMNLQNETVIIAPYFKTSSDAGGDASQIIWSSNGWKRGFQSTNITSVKTSSYSVIDSFIAILNDEERFPFMESIIVTGHSAGAQFTQLYSLANDAPNNDSRVDVNYIVANSQYFFYPGDERYNDATNSFTIPTGCNGYATWPYGYEGAPSYVSRLTADQVNDNMATRPVTYLLGSLDIFTGGTLNTQDCEAVLLGEHRFDRGTKIFDYMEQFYLGSHDHTKVIVPNVGHDAAAMYNSSEARMLMSDLLK